MAKLLGIEIRAGAGHPKHAIYWSGFASQGDGACFEGYYAWTAKSELEYHAALAHDPRLLKIATTLADVQHRHACGVSASVVHRGRYYNSGCMVIDVYHEDDEGTEDDVKIIKQCMRDFAEWIYTRLEEEYEYQHADEQIDENIRANEYEFDINGKRIT